MPVTASGPRICSACAAWMRSWPPSSAMVRMRSSLSAKLRCTNVIASLCWPCGGVEADLPQPAVDLFDRGIQPLVDRLVVGFAADGRAVELLAVEQRDHRVLELHPRHFARQRHVADRELVFAVGREVVLDAEAAARAERHAFDVMLLPARAGLAVRRQRDHHVGDVAVGGRLGGRLGVADRLERDGARGVTYWSMKLGDTCSAAALLSKLPLMLSSGSQAVASMSRPSRSRMALRVLAAVEAAQRHAPGCAAVARGVDLVLEPRDEARPQPGVRAPGACRRHQAAAQLADDFLGDLGVLRRRVQIQFRQRQAARLEPGRCGSPCSTDRSARAASRPSHRRSEGRGQAAARDWARRLAPPTGGVACAKTRQSRTASAAIPVLIPSPFIVARCHTKSSQGAADAQEPIALCPLNLSLAKAPAGMDT